MLAQRPGACRAATASATKLPGWPKATGSGLRRPTCERHHGHSPKHRGRCIRPIRRCAPCCRDPRLQRQRSGGSRQMRPARDAAGCGLCVADPLEPPLPPASFLLRPGLVFRSSRRRHTSRRPRSFPQVDPARAAPWQPAACASRSTLFCSFQGPALSAGPGR